MAQILMVFQSAMIAAGYSVKRTNPTSLRSLSWPLLDPLIEILEGNRQL
jgi:hypothetical protein